MKGEQRSTQSDFMEMEKSRGISISATVMSFDYNELRVNILDTPGHQDFSEDTYRALAAADNAVMLLDAAKGLEPQTRKLFEVVSEYYTNIVGIDVDTRCASHFIHI